METTTIRISSEDKKLLDAIKKETHMSQRWIVHEALNELYNKLNKKKK